MAFDGNDRIHTRAPDDASPLPPDLPPELRSQIDRFRELRERGEQARAQLAAAQASARSRTGSVTVTVGAGGVLHGLQLAEPARKLPLGKLAEDIMAAYRQAAREVAEQGVEIMSGLVGPDSPTLQLMRNAIPDDLPSPEEGTQR